MKFSDIIVEGEAWVQLPDPYSMPEIVVNVTATVSLVSNPHFVSNFVAQTLKLEVFGH